MDAKSTRVTGIRLVGASAAGMAFNSEAEEAPGLRALGRHL